MRTINIYVDDVPHRIQTTGVRVNDCAADCGCKGNAAAADAILASVKDGSMTLRDANIELARLKINGTIVWDGTVYRRIS